MPSIRSVARPPSAILMLCCCTMIISKSIISSKTNNKLGVEALAIPSPQRRVLTANQHDTFETFVTMRTGIDLSKKDADYDAGYTNDKVSFWTGQGQLFESPSGKLLANIDGFDVSKAIRINDNLVRQFSRKIFWFRDPITNLLMDEYQGEEVKPIKYDWQVFDYKRGKPVKVPPHMDQQSNDPGLVPIMPSIVKGVRRVPCQPIIPRYAGPKTLLYQMPLFIDIETPRGRYQAWEFYDYTIDLADGDDSVVNFHRPPSVTWTRQGSNPPFASDGDGVMHFLGHRCDCFEDLPDHMKNLVEQDYHSFRGPPAGMDEVNELEEQLKAMSSRARASVR